jgi:DNA-binding LacI/PurR family transcriptional regulator
MKTVYSTLADVAQKAGVSITTVSHVINKTRHVRSETTDAVLLAIRELNYRTSRKAKSTAAKRREIGVIVGDMREDYFPGIIKAIETTAAELDVSILFCDSETNPEKEKSNIQMLLRRQIDGLILAPTQIHIIPKELKETSIPVVLFDRQYESHKYLFIGINNFQSCYEGTDHIISKGSRKPGFICYEGPVTTMKQRMFGFQTYMLKSKKNPEPDILLLKYTMEDSYPLIKNFILENGLDGLVCANSSICYEAVSVLNDLPEHIKGNFPIICYDDNRWFEYLKYPVSVICQPVAEIGNAALELLYQMINQSSNYSGIKRELLFDVSIVDYVADGGVATPDGCI